MVGKFICLEGMDGSGKTTYARYIYNYLNKRGHKAIQTKEPGGTPLARNLAKLLLNYANEEISPQTELLLFFAARHQHLRQLIIPSLEEGAWVISDRFLASSYAYQGGGHQLGFAQVAALEAYLPLVRPDMTFIFDISVAEAMKRRAGKREDRFERQNSDFFHRVRAAYLEFAARQHGCYVIDSHQSEPSIKKLIDNQLNSL